MQVNEVNRIVTEYIAAYLAGKDYRDQIVFEDGCDGTITELTPLLLDAGAEVVGLDINEGWVKEKKAKFERYPKLRLVCGDAHHLPFKNEVFDVIAIIEVIEHLDKPDLALKETCRCLKSGGKLILSTPNAVGIWSLATDRALFWLRNIGRRIRGMERLEKRTSGHVRLFTLRRLKRSLTSQHFEIEEVISSYGLGMVNLMRAFWEKFRFPTLGRLATLHSLECTVSKIVPLGLHSGWIVFAGKYQDFSD
jgi:ubiquinone/menaquinone biosynthesis C-methylase UbiE